MDLSELRVKIDHVDDEIIRLMTERMDIAAEIAAYKKENGLPVLNAAREREKLVDVGQKSREDVQDYMQVLYNLIFELSRSHQNHLLLPTNRTAEEVQAAIESTPKLFPKTARVACQGVEGAYSTQAAEKLFQTPSIMYVNSFEGAFAAIESGLCQYGVLPIENSTAGSVKQVYDLMVSRNFHIVRSVRIKIDHSLLVKPGTEKSQIKEVFSHPQAISQCEEYLKKWGIKVTACENTAVAAKMVAQSDRTDVAALSSLRCAELYGLKAIEKCVQDKANNHTRFICISKKMEIYPGADKTSLMLITGNRPGSLYKVLAKFFALGINLSKLESRPLPDRDFEFMFYFDLDTSVYSESFIRLICELGDICEEFKYLGSYSEVV